MVFGEVKVMVTIKIKQDKSVVIHVFGFESRVVAFWSSRGKRGAFNRGMLKYTFSLQHLLVNPELKKFKC